VPVPSETGASRVGRGGNPGRASGMGGAAVPPDSARAADAGSAVGTGRIRKVVSEAVSAGAPVRRGGTEG
jgi:hypothetical protein